MKEKNRNVAAISEINEQQEDRKEQINQNTPHGPEKDATNAPQRSVRVEQPEGGEMQPSAPSITSLREEVQHLVEELADESKLSELDDQRLFEQFRMVEGTKTLLRLLQGRIAAYIKEHADYGSFLKRATEELGLSERTIEERIVHYRVFWDPVMSEPRRVAPEYLDLIAVRKLNVLVREANLPKWEIQEGCIILKACRGAGRTAEQFRNKPRLEAALDIPGGNAEGQENDHDSTRQPEGEVVAIRLEPRDLNDGPNGERRRVYELNGTAALDDTGVVFTPADGARVAFCEVRQAVPGDVESLSRRLHWYDALSNEVIEFDLPAVDINEVGSD